jgi:hypothetical protein
MIGATIVLAFGATISLAQANPKSTKRIPVSKEAGGEVVRVDTLTRTDTVTVTNYRTDTLFRTVHRVDTVVVQPPTPPIRLPNGFYLGAAGGTSMPTGSLFTPNSMGYMGQFHLGWQNAKQVIGGRISTTYTGLGQDSRFSALQGDRAQLWTLSTDLKLQAPLGRPWGRSPRLNIYGIGGWTYTWYRNLPFELNEFDNTGVRLFSTGDNSWNGRNGWSAGGGLSILWRRTEVFVESRVMGFRPNDFIVTDVNNVNVGRDFRADYGYQVPIMFGFNWY